MSEAHHLTEDVFRAIIAVAWIDGNLDEAEAEAILRAARDEGLEAEVVARLESATRTPMDFGEIDAQGLTTAERLYVYAVSSWVTMVDGTVDSIEKDALHAVATVLGITGRGRAAMDDVVRELASREDPPTRLDLRGLRDAISHRLA